MRGGPYSSLEARVVRVPGDDGDPDVAGQLEEILGGRHCPPEMLATNNRIVRISVQCKHYYHLQSIFCLALLQIPIYI